MIADVQVVVVDGDTIRLGSERIRIINVDAPEMPAHAKCDAEGSLALVAKERLSAALKGGPVALDRHGQDRYGRTLAYVRIGDTDIGDMMIFWHLAWPWEGHRHSWCGK